MCLDLKALSLGEGAQDEREREWTGDLILRQQGLRIPVSRVLLLLIIHRHLVDDSDDN